MEEQARQALATARAVAQRGGLLESHHSENGNTPSSASSAVIEADSGSISSPSGGNVAVEAAANQSVTPTLVQTNSGRVGTVVREEELGSASNASPSASDAPAFRLTSQPGSSSTSGDSVRAPFLERLQAFGRWLREGSHAQAFFLTDQNGSILIDEVQSPKLRQVARTLAQASRAANRQAGAEAIGNLHVKVTAESCLEVVPLTTQYGPFVLGMIVPQPLGLESVQAIISALRQVTDQPSPS